ncbi:hypothetical protein SPBRAN_970 [uncultured Candidatus Thioglobus sp.]|nr:hypothetical protein SPBRAN_970 [uncultured Candidatus Thioglobus sp.]
MNNHQHTTFYQLSDFIKACRNSAGTSLNKNTNSAKSGILMVTPIHTKDF